MAARARARPRSHSLLPNGEVCLSPLRPVGRDVEPPLGRSRPARLYTGTQGQGEAAPGGHGGESRRRPWHIRAPAPQTRAQTPTTKRDHPMECVPPQTLCTLVALWREEGGASPPGPPVAVRGRLQRPVARTRSCRHCTTPREQETLLLLAKGARRWTTALCLVASGRRQRAPEKSPELVRAVA